MILDHLKRFKKTSGNSLMEFAVTIGLMAILAATAVFGTDNPKALMPSGSNFIDDTLSSDVNQAGEVICRNCPLGRMKGSDEWLGLFNREELVSPFQDGHYIYIVIPGYGSGEDVVAPKICVADGESPKHLHKIMEL